MKKIAITAYRQAPSGSAFKFRQYLSNEAYADAVAEEDAIPCILPYTKFLEPSKLIKGFDGLLLTGGDDIDPELYGEENRDCHKVDREIDIFQIRLILEAYKQNIPILGICRGLQLINVAFGGTLYQDIKKETASSIKHDVLDNAYGHAHRVRVEKNTLLYKLYGDSIEVNSLHHQGIKTLGKGLIASAFSPDGVIEAVESDRLIGVQWHPEAIHYEMKKLFSFFIKEM